MYISVIKQGFNEFKRKYRLIIVLDYYIICLNEDPEITKR